MKIKLLLTTIFALALACQAQTFGDKVKAPETWNFTLSGSGATTVQDTDTVFGFEADLFKDIDLGIPWQIGLRQAVNFNDFNDETLTLLTTTLHADWRMLRIKKFELLLGGAAALTYGNTEPVWTAGPEGILRFFVKSNVFIDGRVGYGFNLNDTSNRDRDLITYNLGIGFKF